MKKNILLILLISTICRSQPSPLTGWDPLDKEGILKALGNGEGEYKEDLSKKQFDSKENTTYVYSNYNSSIRFLQTSSGIINDFIHLYSFKSIKETDIKVEVFKIGVRTRYNTSDSDWKITKTDSTITRTYDSKDKVGMIINIVSGIYKNPNIKPYYCFLRIYTNQGNGLVAKEEELTENNLNEEYTEAEFQGEEEIELTVPKHALGMRLTENGWESVDNDNNKATTSTNKVTSKPKKLFPLMKGVSVTEKSMIGKWRVSDGRIFNFMYGKVEFYTPGKQMVDLQTNYRENGVIYMSAWGMTIAQLQVISKTPTKMVLYNLETGNKLNLTKY